MLHKLFCMLPVLLCSISAHATTWHTDANLDYSVIRIVGHTSKLISSVSYFSIIGTAYGADSGLQGIYSNQDQDVMHHCLAMAEQFSLSRRTGASPLFRIQVKPDPSNAGFALIQYCTLYQ